MVGTTASLRAALTAVWRVAATVVSWAGQKAAYWVAVKAEPKAGKMVDSKVSTSAARMASQTAEHSVDLSAAGLVVS